MQIEVSKFRQTLHPTWYRAQFSTVVKVNLLEHSQATPKLVWQRFKGGLLKVENPELCESTDALGQFS